MKINRKILSIPPYISTSWKNVVSLHKKETQESLTLMITLVNGSTIEVPHLEKPVLESVFAAHEKHLENEIENPVVDKGAITGPMMPGPFPGEVSALLSLPMNFGPDGAIGGVFQHNSEASDTPDLPTEILDKIATLSKSIGLEDGDKFPKAEPHCNCMHCQIMREIHQEERKKEKEHHEELVSDEELSFREWDIENKGEKLYKITNPLNKEEHYNVFLGSPLGCTCGQSNCEHIRSVLNS
ncbi:MAG: hypothetical protein KR126chlam1_00582 [Chlamydiae bacterium]|nr:hypothetical protein [Chlamydiota bacterium]